VCPILFTPKVPDQVAVEAGVIVVHHNNIVCLATPEATARMCSHIAVAIQTAQEITTGPRKEIPTHTLGKMEHFPVVTMRPPRNDEVSFSAALAVGLIGCATKPMQNPI
jgi:hypothetical protein